MVAIVAMLLFGVMGLGALVIDMGLVRLTQDQMQVGVDPAALEGLRRRDARNEAGEPLGDAVRREAASLMASFVYDDDLDPVNVPTQPFILGAGPELTLSDGITEFNASQVITLPVSPTYRPTLETNIANHVHGDMVAGTFVPPAFGTPVVEDAMYGRNDFIPSEPADSSTANAFLVRLRRTNDFDGLDNQAGVSASGGPIPLLLGQGSMTSTFDPDSPHRYHVRMHGFTVRATAVADARPALRVGFPQPTGVPPIEGALPFALDVTLWNGLVVGQSVTLAVDDAGTISGNGLSVAGRFTPPPPDPAAVTTVGQAVIPAAPIVHAERTGYVPIYQVLDEGGAPVERVIGFGHLAAAGSPGEVIVTRLPGLLAPINATRHLSGWVPVLPDPTEWATVLAANRVLADPVLAPVLVR